MTSIRSSSYSIEEDMHLCHVYLDVSQNPIIGINQSKDQFWARVENEYQKSEIFNRQPRPRRSLQTRMTTILSAVSKLRGCVNKIENKNPRGASEQDIHILKGIEKFANNNTNASVAFQEDRQKVEVAKMKEENKILFADISSITDPASRAYIENERKIILKKRAQTNQSEEHGEGSQYQYQGSQYRASQAQGEDQISPNDPENFTPYYNYLSGANNNLVRNKKRRYREKSSGSERVSSHSKRHKPSPDARSSMSCASPWDLGAASPSPIRPLVPPAVEEPINLRIYGKELREGILLGSCMDGGMMMILTRGTQIVRPLIPMKLTLAKCYLLSVRNSLGLKQRLLNGKTVSFSVPELLEAHNCKLGSVEKKKKKKKKERVVLLVHDPKLPPFLDNGRAVFTKQVEPVKDPTSDMAIVSRKRSGLVREIWEKQGLHKSRQRFWELAGSNLGVEKLGKKGEVDFRGEGKFAEHIKKRRSCE
ncbi:BnaC01g27460D [Brassica napus]|uniref:BnaC01g27460D protein n=3 Tax=Brassica TaxID=3705 RepID=A0A078GZ87_BRANA|nr:BnaC01g27460D [Brassica napus]VDD51123.1 unnamed protein product [Brassica oleracea]